MILNIEIFTMYIISLLLAFIFVKLIDILTSICNSSDLKVDNQEFILTHDFKRKKTRSGKFY